MHARGVGNGVHVHAQVDVCKCTGMQGCMHNREKMHSLRARCHSGPWAWLQADTVKCSVCPRQLLLAWWCAEEQSGGGS